MPWLCKRHVVSRLDRAVRYSLDNSPIEKMQIVMGKCLFASSPVVIHSVVNIAQGFLVEGSVWSV